MTARASAFGSGATRTSRSPNHQVPYSQEALRQDLARVRRAWEDCQASRKRDAIYGYLSAVFDLVAWWAAEDRANARARWALRLCRLEFASDEPFAAIILATADREKVDKRTRSKWSRALRYALHYKSHSESLERFIKRNRGINACARRFARDFHRNRKSPSE